MGDLQPWEDPDDLLEALYKLGEQTRGQAGGAELTKTVAALLDHEDEDIRQEALRLLLVQWKVQDVRDQAVELLRLDSSEAVRGTAAYGIAATSTSATHRDDVRTLLGILVDETQPVHVRGAAYKALLIIHRRAEFPPMTRNLDPDTDVDWQWIRTLQKDVTASGA